MTKAYTELKNMTIKELESRYAELRKELMRLKSQVATRTIPEKPGRIRQIRRTMARIITITKNKEVRQKG